MDFDQFVTGRLPALVRYAAALAGERELAKDIVQDVLIRAHARWHRIGAMDQPDHYVKRMVTNEYLSWHRRRSRRAALLADNATLLPSQVFVTDHAEQTVERSALARQLADLPAKHRAVLVLGYYQGLDDSGIAGLLGCSTATVRVYRSRALAALRSVLGAPMLMEEMS